MAKGMRRGFDSCKFSSNSLAKFGSHFRRFTITGERLCSDLELQNIINAD